MSDRDNVRRTPPAGERHRARRADLSGNPSATNTAVWRLPAAEEVVGDGDDDKTVHDLSGVVGGRNLS